MSTPSSALSRCSAVVVGHAGESRSLIDIAHRLCFGSVQELNEQPDIRRPEFQVTYFLVNQKLSDQTKSQLVRRLRRSPSTKIRCAPIVAIGTDVDFEVVLDHIGMGFDDFISLPERLDLVKDRLINQLDQTHIYIETATYFGPDRRRMEAPDFTNEQRRSIPHSHTRMEIRRRPDTGVEILRRQIFA
ncbi:hypothetical protein NIM87_18130 [Devosia sp. XJ19-1]|uniref:Uncharacterized protein n=1 Tax=Devosia ureilytica TaxID=2952754 RepID=A0A9Q4AQS3_9HYPH|nr:hypothetical protein [Devosia ureilytica]MCP8885428.1 hypothetical protein [Devosia ureilytica]MCP8888105.1 hypothetical protein [Devosia ureilytica]